MPSETHKGATLFGNPVSASARRKGAAMFRRFARKYHYDPDAHYPLVARDNPILGPALGVKDVFSGGPGEAIDYDRGVVIGTIRMGYGHYRIGMAVASAARALGYTPYWLDLLGFDSAGARMIRDLDKWYSLGSRLSQQSKLFNRLLWDPLMGKWYKRLEKNYPIMQAAKVFSNVYRDFPKDMPLLATHPFNALGAIHAGMTNVVNMIPDNCPLGFHLADGALQTVQSPSAYFLFRTLKDMDRKGGKLQSIPAQAIRIAGHYIDHELVANIEADCAARLRRMAAKAPRRLLISIGGAGAQQQLLAAIVCALMPRIRDGRMTLFINFGDHRNAWECFCRNVPEFQKVVQMHSDWTDSNRFVNDVGRADAPGAHAFLHDDVFCAVYATNLLMRVSDILLTKPSELAFYPIPKLLIERVGGHEAWGAIRAAELGDGTVECQGLPFILQTLDMLLDEDDLLGLYCDNIRKLNSLGIYNGACRVVEWAANQRQPGR